MRFPLLVLGCLAGVTVATSEFAGESSLLNKRLVDGSLTDDNLYELLESRDLATDIWNQIKSTASCAGCQAALALLKGLALLGDKTFVSALQEICRLSGAMDADVCNGAIALEGPLIAQDLRSVKLGSKTSELICISFLGLCPYPDVTPQNFVTTPKPAKNRPVPSGQDPIKIVHYSDIHIDTDYVEGSNANCTKPICCRSFTPTDSPGQNSAPAGKNGEHRCDTPTTLEESMYAAIGQLAPGAKFTIFTGDIVDHAVWLTSQSQNTIDIDDAYAKMAAASGEGGPSIIYGTAGNHEASPTNAFPPNAAKNKAAQWVYDALSAAWTQWIGVSAAGTTKSFGAYSTRYPGGNLRVISLSTNMYYIQNYYLYEEPMQADPNGQLAWLGKELAAAEAAGERVYIVGHMPMGAADAFHDGSNYFDQLVNRYSATIAAMFFGHTHKDHFQLSYADYAARSYQGATAMSYIAPSLTPTSGMPAFRVYDVDPVTFAVLDSTTYAADMTDPAFQTTGPVWKKYYSAKEAYGPLVAPPLTAPAAELSPAFWHNVTVALEASQPAFDAYYARKSRGWNVAPCQGACRTLEICGLRAARSQDNCVVPSPGLHIAKRGLGGMALGVEHGGEQQQWHLGDEHHDECGLSITRAVMGSLATGREGWDLLERRMLEKRAELAAEA